MTHEEMTTQMTSKLKLKDSQKTKVAALNKEYQDYLMPEPPQKPEGDKASDKKKSSDGKKQASKKPDQKPNNSQNSAKRQEYDKKLKQILTDDQYKNYQKMQPGCNGPKDKQKKQKKN